MRGVVEKNPTPSSANEGNYGSQISLSPNQQKEKAVPPSQKYDRDNHQHVASPPPPPVAFFRWSTGSPLDFLSECKGMMSARREEGQVRTIKVVSLKAEWKSGLFDCFHDPWNALITMCFPCVTFGQIAEIVDQGKTSCGKRGVLYNLILCCIAMPCLLSCGYRSKLRNEFSLVESPVPDCVVHCFCECCALCQEYRELKTRGYDPAIGWQANSARMRPVNARSSIAMSPPVQPLMMGR